MCPAESKGGTHSKRGGVAGREAGGCGAAAAQAARSRKARLKPIGGQGTRGALLEHVGHVRNLGGVEAHRLVEQVRGLPSRREGHAMRGEVRAGRREGVGRRRRKRHAQGRPDSRREGQGTRGAHVEHGLHVRDLGGVKAQRLVEGIRVLPSRREGHMRYGARCGPGGGTGREAASAQAACTGEGRLKAVGGQGTRGAHPEHGVHVSDLGRVKAQRLVERVRGLPSRREGHMRCGARLRAGRREGVGRWRRKRHARGRPDSRLLGARARAGRTNIQIMSVTSEVSKLSGWLKADVHCRVEGRACDAGRGARREVGGRGAAASQAACTGEGPIQGCWGPGHARSALGTSGSCP